jgi:hypothetical protein
MLATCACTQGFMVEYDASSRNIATGSFIACYILFLLVLRPFENLKITVRPPSFSLKLLEPNLSVLVGNTPGPLMAQGHAGAPLHQKQISVFVMNMVL